VVATEELQQQQQQQQPPEQSEETAVPIAKGNSFITSTHLHQVLTHHHHKYIRISAHESSDEDDNDNITVTVPPAHLQSRGAAFRDARMRRNMGSNSDASDVHSRESHSNSRANEEYGEDGNGGGGGSSSVTEHSSYQKSLHIPKISHQNVAPHNNNDDNNKNPYQQQPPMSNSSSDYNNSGGGGGGDPQPMYPNPGMYSQQSHHQQSQIPTHSMYNNHGHYPPPPHHGQPYFPPQNKYVCMPPFPNRIASHSRFIHHVHSNMRPMRFDNPPNNYQQQHHQQPVLRHHQQQQQHVHHQQQMRPQMHDNYNMRQRVPTVNVINAVAQNIQQRFGTE